MYDILTRVWQNLVGRLEGPLNLRLVIQPAVAIILATRAGFKDARENRPPFLWTILRDSSQRRELLRHGWKDVGKVFILSTILDVIYQLVVHRAVYTLELLLTAFTLAIIPYIVVRGPVNRIVRMMSADRSGVHNASEKAQPPSEPARGPLRR